MPVLSADKIKKMQESLCMLFQHAKNINPDSLETSTDFDTPLVSSAFSICTAMILIYHRADKKIEPSLFHLSSPYLGFESKEFLRMRKLYSLQESKAKVTAQNQTKRQQP